MELIEALWVLSVLGWLWLLEFRVRKLEKEGY